MNRAEHASAEPQHGEIFLVRGFLQSFVWQVYVFVSVMIAVTTHETKISRGFELLTLRLQNPRFCHYSTSLHACRALREADTLGGGASWHRPN
jgi:hypothetical protein